MPRFTRFSATSARPDRNTIQKKPGQLRVENSVLRAQRIITEELDRLRWHPEQLSARRKNDPAKLAIAARLRNETTLTIKEITQRLHLGTANPATTALHRHLRSQARSTPITSPGQKEFIGI